MSLDQSESENLQENLQLSPEPNSSSSSLSSLTFSKVLGQGAFGTVLQACDPTSGSITAVKFVFPASEKDAKLTQRETSIPSQLPRHANIVQILAVEEKVFNLAQLDEIFANRLYQKGGRRPKWVWDYLIAVTISKSNPAKGICIQQEICGEDLRKWLNSEEKVTHETLPGLQLALVTDLITGLAYLHKNRVMHRDFKPENVLFSQTGYQLPVKIADFGLSRLLHSDESRTNVLTTGVGTGSYMAPEVWGEGGQDYSYQADIFSLGLVIWEIVQLIGFPERRKLFDSLLNDGDEGVVKKNGAMPWTRGLIIGMTRKKVDKRLGSMEEVVDILRNEQNKSKLNAKNKKLISGCTIL